MKYDIAVTEQKSYYYEIEAEDLNEAFDKAEALWHTGKGHTGVSDVEYGDTWEL